MKNDFYLLSLLIGGLIVLIGIGYTINYAFMLMSQKSFLMNVTGVLIIAAMLAGVGILIKFFKKLKK